MSIKRAIITLACVLAAIYLVMGSGLFRRARWSNNYSPCKIELRQLDSAKTQWATEGGKTTNDVPTWNELQPYWRRTPACPQGGNYTLGRVGEPPTCSVHGRDQQPTSTTAK